MRRIRIWTLKVRNNKRKIIGLSFHLSREEAEEAMCDAFDDDAFECEIENKLMHRKDALELFRGKRKLDERV